MAKTKAAQRRDAAEEVCFTVILMMQLGLLELPMENRKLLADPMEKWSSLAFDTGLMTSEENDPVSHSTK